MAGGTGRDYAPFLYMAYSSKVTGRSIDSPPGRGYYPSQTILLCHSDIDSTSRHVIMAAREDPSSPVGRTQDPRAPQGAQADPGRALGPARHPAVRPLPHGEGGVPGQPGHPLPHPRRVQGRASASSSRGSPRSRSRRATSSSSRTSTLFPRTSSARSRSSSLSNAARRAAHEAGPRQEARHEEAEESSQVP